MKSYSVGFNLSSPLLANVYLHYVFDLWIQAWRKKRAHGDVMWCGLPTTSWLDFRRKRMQNAKLSVYCSFRICLYAVGVGLPPSVSFRLDFLDYAA